MSQGISPGSFDPVTLSDTGGITSPSIAINPIDTPGTSDLTTIQAAPVSDIAELSTAAPSAETPLVTSPVLPEEIPTIPSVTSEDLAEIPAPFVEPTPFVAPTIFPETTVGRTAAIATTTAAAGVVVPGFMSNAFEWVKMFFKSILAFFTTQTGNEGVRKWIMWGLILLVVILLLNWLSCTVCSWTGGCKREGFHMTHTTRNSKKSGKTGWKNVVHPYNDPRTCVNQFDKKKDCQVPIGSGLLPWKVQILSGLPPTIEQFVPFNSEVVGKNQISLVRMDQMDLNGAFDAIVNEDKGKINIGSATQFRAQPTSREQGRMYINSILRRINIKADRKFHILDIQSLGKQEAFFPKDKQIVQKWTTELFVQEKDHRKVHAQAYNIRIQFYVKNDVIQIIGLHFITDHFYQRPLIDGDNKYARNFRIKNPFHLQQPFLTTEDKVLPNTGTGVEILAHHHKDLRTPQYRCFDGAANAQTTGGHGLGYKKVDCDLASGYWDKPVERDSECPFFRANKNYPNRLGGVNINGNTCEMPMGTKTIGYRHISNDPAHKILVYNCKIGKNGSPGSIGFCYEEQMDKSQYPNLVSPDVAYEGDSLERWQNRHILAERGLNWRSHPTNIRDILNKNQRQPVFNAIIGNGPGKLNL